ncbi:MAG: glyoxalase [Bacteroidota bacterium]
MMKNLSQQNPVSIRPFIGSKNFERSRNFYKDMGFSEVVLDAGLSVFRWGKLSFYLQDAYVKDWIDNTMLFMEVENVKDIWEALIEMDLTSKYAEVRIGPIRVESWGQECFLHDPSGVLWHFGEFS